MLPRSDPAYIGARGSTFAGKLSGFDPSYHAVAQIANDIGMSRQTTCARPDADGRKRLRLITKED